MGQSNIVKVFRYIMKNTVEEVRFRQSRLWGHRLGLALKANMIQRILALQKKKTDLVKFTIDGSSRDGVSGTLEVITLLSQGST